MPVTMKEVRAHLDPDEPDYPAAAAELGPDALPHLRELVSSSDTHIASKAAYLASLMPDERAIDVLSAAAGSPYDVVRVSAAAGIRNLGDVARPRGATGDEAGDPVLNLLDRLLSDDDVGVRKLALQSAEAINATALVSKVRAIADSDPQSELRALATESVARLTR